MRAAAWAILVGASIWAFALVPALPFQHLDDPFHLGVLGYGVVLAGLALKARSGWGVVSPAARLVRVFLVGLPLVYLAGALRFSASVPLMGLQVLGLMAWGFAAVRSRRHAAWLWLACAAHVLWDLLHLGLATAGRAGFVPVWYTKACILIDAGLAVFLLLQARADSMART